MAGKQLPDADLISRILGRYRATSCAQVALDQRASDDLPKWMPGKSVIADRLAIASSRLADLQERLYASADWAVLLVFQGMDAAGKDSTIGHVLSGLNPQGLQVTSFKAPDPHELAHDFLWRVHAAVPARRMIGVFNRSHYEDVLAPRVHPQLLDGAHLPKALQDGALWEQRIADIAAFESYLARQGVRIVKFFLDVGQEEQKKRLLARLETPDKLWKFDPGDLKERALWDHYREAYTAALEGTASEAAPWYIVPADRKWFMRFVVAEAVIDALERLDLEPREATKPDEATIEQARATLKSQ
jgi:PPK2 family polyphosphate:nucleotide phosphotransferase